MDVDSYLQLERGIQRGAARVLGSSHRDLLPDATQEAWVKVLKHEAKGGPPIDKPFAFGWQTGLWAALSQLEKEKMHRPRYQVRTSSSPPGDELDGESLASDGGMEAKNIEGFLTVREILAEIRSTLTKRQREILSYTLLGCRQNQIAQTLGVSKPLVCNEIKIIKKTIARILSLDDDNPQGPSDSPRRVNRRGRGALQDVVGYTGDIMKNSKHYKDTILDTPMPRSAVRQFLHLTLQLPAFAELDATSGPSQAAGRPQDIRDLLAQMDLTPVHDSAQLISVDSYQPTADGNSQALAEEREGLSTSLSKTAPAAEPWWATRSAPRAAFRRFVLEDLRRFTPLYDVSSSVRLAADGRIYTPPLNSQTGGFFSAWQVDKVDRYLTRFGWMDGSGSVCLDACRNYTSLTLPTGWFARQVDKCYLTSGSSPGFINIEIDNNVDVDVLKLIKIKLGTLAYPVHTSGSTTSSASGWPEFFGVPPVDQVGRGSSHSFINVIAAFDNFDVMKLIKIKLGTLAYPVYTSGSTTSNASGWPKFFGMPPVDQVGRGSSHGFINVIAFDNFDVMKLIKIKLGTLAYPVYTSGSTASNASGWPEFFGVPPVDQVGRGSSHGFINVIAFDNFDVMKLIKIKLGTLAYPVHTSRSTTSSASGWPEFFGVPPVDQVGRESSLGFINIKKLIKIKLGGALAEPVYASGSATSSASGWPEFFGVQPVDRVDRGSSHGFINIESGGTLAYPIYTSGSTTSSASGWSVLPFSQVDRGSSPGFIKFNVYLTRLDEEEFADFVYTSTSISTFAAWPEFCVLLVVKKIEKADGASRDFSVGLIENAGGGLRRVDEELVN
jgi:DNA-directed RNA polymerase specialized sigma24 family protein